MATGTTLVRGRVASVEAELGSNLSAVGEATIGWPTTSVPFCRPECGLKSDPALIAVSELMPRDHEPGDTALSDGLRYGLPLSTEPMSDVLRLLRLALSLASFGLLARWWLATNDGGMSSLGIAADGLAVLESCMVAAMDRGREAGSCPWLYRYDGISSLDRISRWRGKVHKA